MITFFGGKGAKSIIFTPPPPKGLRILLTMPLNLRKKYPIPSYHNSLGILRYCWNIKSNRPVIPLILQEEMDHLFQQRTAVRVNSMLSAIEPKMIILQKESLHHGDVVDVV